jgi:nucleoside-triphosphatase THEP1
MKNHPGRQLLLLTGPRGSGKSTWCSRLISQAREEDLNPGGLLSPAIFHDGKKIGIDLLDITSGNQRSLARRGVKGSQGIRLGDWCFDAATLAWGNQILHTLKGHELILLDELGPLEFEKGLGLVAGLKLIDEKKFQLAVVVIRQELLQTARIRWPNAEVVDVSYIEPNLHLLKRNVA